MGSYLRISIILFITIYAGLTSTKAQNDSIIFNNKDIMVGEIKNLKQGIIQVETDYSDSDFKAEWNKINYVKTEQIFLINTTKGDRFTGTIETIIGDSLKMVIHDLKNGDITFEAKDIVWLKSVEQSFISRLDFLISVGYSLTKANNNHQFSGLTSLSYLSNTYGLDANYSMIASFQEETQDSITVKISTRRYEGGGGLRFFIVRDWFAVVSTSLLKSSEQQLDLRSVTKAGIGNYLIKNQQMYFLITGGAAWNYENYTTPSPEQINPRNSAEAFLGLEYNLFDYNDLDIKTSIFGYPSLTESGRFRTDLKFDIRYEFAFDLSFGVGFILNYDSSPAAGSSPNDYVLQTTIGWEL